MPVQTGARVGPYQILAPLGAGGMGQVYRATDTKLGRDVAIKVLPADVAHDPERLARFEREARLLASINHPNVAHVYGFEAATLPDATAYQVKGVFLGLTELLDKAVSCAERALALDPKLAEAHVALGSALFALGRNDHAATALDAAIAHDPKHARAHAMLARVHWIGRGDITSGIRELERAIAINPQFGYAHLQLANLYTEKGEYARAEDAARRAVDLQEQYISGEEGFLVVGAHARLGYVFYRLGRYGEALKEYQTELLYLSASDHVLKERSLIELHQKLGAVYLRLDNAKDGRRHLDLAIRLFTQRAARGESDPATAYYIGVAYALLDDVEHAVRYLQHAIEARGGQNRRRAAQDPDLATLRPALEALGLVELQIAD